MKQESLVFKIANALLNAGLIKENISPATLEAVIEQQMPVIDTRSKKKVHWLDPRSTGGPVCGGGRDQSPQITPDKEKVSCRNCRGTYLFDGEEARY